MRPYTLKIPIRGDGTHFAYDNNISGAQFNESPKNQILTKLTPDEDFKSYLCPGLDSNQHTLRRRHLKAVRLPISPPGLRESLKLYTLH
jgi:hypothetical protein